jgi:hypothetical protein
MEVTSGNADAATGSNQPQMLNEEMEEEHSLTANVAALKLRAGSERTNKPSRR